MALKQPPSTLTYQRFVKKHMEYLAVIEPILGHIAWPITVILISFILKNELRNIVTAIGKRIEDRNSSVSITKDGLVIDVIKANSARIATLQAEQDIFRPLALRNLETNLSSSSELTSSTATRNNEIDNHLLGLADNYMNIRIQDYNESLMAKNAAADEMALYVVYHKTNKDLLAQENNDGLRLALAGSVLLSPENGDAERIMKAADGAKMLHVRYRILLAIIKIIENNLLPRHQFLDVRNILTKYEEGADDQLKRLINNVRGLVKDTESIIEVEPNWDEDNIGLGLG